MEKIEEIDTVGMLRSRVNFTKPGRKCPDCGLVIPTYPGRYPKSCPDCNCDNLQPFDTSTGDGQAGNIMKVIKGMSNQI